MAKMQGSEYGISPDVVRYTSVINAIARSRRHPERVEDILDRMADEGVSPNVITYTAAINGMFGLAIASTLLRG